MIQFSMTAPEFLQSYHTNKPKVFKNAIVENKVNWGYINEFLQRSCIDQNYFQLSLDGIVDKSEYIESYY